MPKRKTICTAFLLPLTLTGWSLHCTAQKELSWVGGTVFVFGDVFEGGWDRSPPLSASQCWRSHIPYPLCPSWLRLHVGGL